MKLIPLDDRLLIKPDEVEEKIGSIVIPEESRQKQTTGVILAAGPTVDEPLLCPGARVLYGKYAGIEFESLQIIREADALCVVEES